MSSQSNLKNVRCALSLNATPEITQCLNSTLDMKQVYIFVIIFQMIQLTINFTLFQDTLIWFVLYCTQDSNVNTSQITYATKDCLSPGPI